MPDIWMDVDAALSEVPVNIFPLTDDTDFKSRETTVAYNATGMDLVWNFFSCAGAWSQTAVTPTTGGDYDWTHKGDGYYKIEIPASGGASINNDTEGVGFFSGICDGVLPWRGPTIGFRDSDLNDKLIESAWSATRGLGGTALPDAAADAAGGLMISDDGGWDADELYDAIITDAAGANIAADIIAAQGNITDILEDTSITVPTAISAVSTKVDTAQADLDTITGTGGVLIGTDAMDRSATLDVNTKTLTAGSITNATLNADVGSTAYATNIIALAVRKVLDEIKLDHLVAVADADDVVDDSIIGKLASTDGDWSNFVDTTDSLQSIRDHIGDGTNLTEAGGDGDHLVEAGGDGDQLTAIPDFTANGSLSGVALATMIDRIYTILDHKMNITDADGSVALRNSGDSGDIATGSVTDNDTTTVRAALSWV